MIGHSLQLMSVLEVWTCVDKRREKGKTKLLPPLFLVVARPIGRKEREGEIERETSLERKKKRKKRRKRKKEEEGG